MVVLDLARGHNETTEAMAAAHTEEPTGKNVTAGTTEGLEATSDSLSLVEENEKEIVEHPDEITKDAQIGVQKVEAAALVWSKTAVYAIYAW